jgi:tetratricopeptide (TPR) repeat protein
MRPVNAVVWDFVSLETELKVQLLSVLYEDSAARQALRPGRDPTGSNYLDPDRCSIDLGGRVLPAGQLAFAFWFEQRLAELTEAIGWGRQRTSEELARGTMRQDTKLDRTLRILLQIRQEAAMWLGRQRSHSSSPQSWKDEYYFALAAYSLHAAAAYDELQAAFALVCAGVAVARMNLARTLIREAIATQCEAPGPYPAYQVPLCCGYDLWKTGDDDARREALRIFETHYDNCRHAVPFLREYALLLAAVGEHQRARDLVEPLRLLAREFGDYEILCRIARTYRDEGNKQWDENTVAVDRIREHPTCQWYETALELYEEAFDISEHYYPGVCTAQLAASLGALQQAREVADLVLRICDRFSLDHLAVSQQFWVLDSRAIALLITGDTPQAVRLYRDALKLVPSEKAGPVQISYDGICRLYWALGEDVVRAVADVFWQSQFSLKPGPMGDCGRRATGAKVAAPT